MRYCRDCEHYETRPEGAPICERFKKEFVISEHPVYGARMGFSAPECEVARSESGQCGPLARYWVARAGTAPWVEQQERERVMRDSYRRSSPARKGFWQMVREIFA